jgi:hypothetical protein
LGVWLIYMYVLVKNPRTTIISNSVWYHDWENGHCSETPNINYYVDNLLCTNAQAILSHFFTNWTHKLYICSTSQNVDWMTKSEIIRPFYEVYPCTGCCKENEIGLPLFRTSCILLRIGTFKQHNVEVATSLS